MIDNSQSIFKEFTQIILLKTATMLGTVLCASNRVLIKIYILMHKYLLKS